MSRCFIVIAVVVIAVGAVSRGQAWLVAKNAISQFGGPPVLTRDVVESMGQARALNQIRQVVGVQSIEHQVFDPEAVVVMLVGDDLQPGVAGVDDDGNGIVDDRSELGASRSDDVCNVLTPTQLVSADNESPKLVLQYGAFVTVNSAEPRLGPPVQIRAILHGCDESPWSFVVE